MTAALCTLSFLDCRIDRGDRKTIPSTHKTNRWGFLVASDEELGLASWSVADSTLWVLFVHISTDGRTPMRGRYLVVLENTNSPASRSSPDKSSVSAISRQDFQRCGIFFPIALYMYILRTNRLAQSSANVRLYGREQS